MSVIEMLTELQAKINENPHKIIGFRATYHFELSGEDSGTFQVTFADDTVQVYDGTPDQPNCTLAMSDVNFIKLLKGDLNPTAAFMMGKIKLKGELGLALKLQQILDAYR